MKTQTFKDIEKRMSKEESISSDKEIAEDLGMDETDERKRKWKIYHDAKEWIEPYPSWFNKPLEFTLEEFVERFKISKGEATKLIERLIKDKRLKKSDTKENVYIAIRVCDICGKEFDDWDLQENHHHYHNFGYGSAKHDLESIEFDVCAECFDKIVDAILPLFPKSPMSQMEIYSEAPEHHPYITETIKHDNDPY